MADKIYYCDVRRMFDHCKLTLPNLRYFVTNEGGDDGIVPVDASDTWPTYYLCGVPTWSVTAW